MIDVERGPEAVPFARQVTIRVTGDDEGPGRRLRSQVMALLAEQPRALLCDLSQLAEVPADVLEVLRAVDRHQEEWPGTPVGVVCRDPQLKHRVAQGHQGRLVVGRSVARVEQMLARLPSADHASMTLEPGLTAPRSARAFVARACLGWQTLSVTGRACLVTSELVTNAVLHADTAVRLTVSHCPGRLRVAVQDDDEMRPAITWTTEGPLAVSGRGLLLVSSVCRAWGVYPTTGDGKVVWAVLDE